MKTRSAKDLLKERYGERGSESREKFREEAFSYYFGEIVKTRRKELKLSQAQLAERIGKKRPYVSRIEKWRGYQIIQFSLGGKCPGSLH